jgi:hypothetical protein
MEMMGYDSSSHLSGEEELTRKELVTKIRETLDNVAEELYQIQQDVTLLGDSVSQAHKLLQLLEHDGDTFILPMEDRFIGTRGDEWRVENLLTNAASEETGHEDIILVDAKIVDESKSAAKPTKKEKRLAGQERAREWAKNKLGNGALI